MPLPRIYPSQEGETETGNCSDLMTFHLNPLGPCQQTQILRVLLQDLPYVSAACEWSVGVQGAAGGSAGDGNFSSGGGG